jgi:prepilin-type N-terminal cleavage/methylation domain-containing protein
MHQKKNRLRRRSQGFSLIELVIVVAIILITIAVAIPMATSTIKFYQLQSGVTSMTGLVRATRFRAMSSGYPYQIVFTKSSSTYQIQQDTAVSGSFANVTSPGSSGTMSGTSTNITLGADLTMQFSPSGAVKYVTVVGGVTTAQSCSNSAGANCQIALTYGSKTKTITVTGFGNVTVT